MKDQENIRFIPCGDAMEKMEETGAYGKGAAGRDLPAPQAEAGDGEGSAEEQAK